MDAEENEASAADGLALVTGGGGGSGGRGGGAAQVPGAAPPAGPPAGEALDPTEVARHSYLGGAYTGGGQPVQSLLNTAM